MSLWGRLLGDTIDLAAAVTAPVAVAAPTSTAGAASRVLLNDPRAVHRQIARSIPAVRKALHVIVGTSSTFALAAWNDEGRLDAADPRTSWIRQPDPRATLQTTLAHTLDDLVFLLGYREYGGPGRLTASACLFTWILLRPSSRYNKPPTD